ncbi:relaxase domain-containing protein [Nocardia cyriacigeorgica]|nr:relaxase domain-containing protein [Nocardia cyriacigeorgica]MBF6346317.1 relaxase domain-containing protein [Nocardia cyriacigeorgica]
MLAWVLAGGMTATIHKVVAGNGYQYYLRNVAANDNSDRGRSSLSDYYSAHGESPGRWHGTGLAALGIGVGAEVTEEQMESLFGLGRHPNADDIESREYDKRLALGAKPADAARAADKASRLGNPFRVYAEVSEFRKRCETAFREYNSAHGQGPTAAIPDDERARIRTRLAFEGFTDEYGRAPIDARELSGWVAKNSRPRSTAVAGFDITFSPVKSVSAVWALAPRSVSEKIEAAHHAAVGDALAWLEQHAVFTRLGRNGIRQVDVDGTVAARFTHRDSRAGDPDLHTHVLIANRVRTLDGLWRTLDGAAIYRVVVTVSEIYNTRLEHHLEHSVGVEFAPRADPDPGKRPIREILGIPEALIDAWSKREAALQVRLGELAAVFQQRFGREPVPTEMYRLAQQATLETRPAKHMLRSLAEQRASWRTEAITLLGGREALARMVSAVLNPPRSGRISPTPEWIARTARRVLDVVAEQRSTWREHNVRAEAERQLRGQITGAEWERVVAAVVSEALSPQQSIALGDPDTTAEPILGTVPAPLARRSGANVHVRAGDQIYTSTTALAIEAALIELAVQPGGRSVAAELVSAAVLDHNQAFPDRPLNAGQTGVIAAFATSAMRVHTANAPAGSGKTTAMKVLTSAWHASGGSVLGLAPTAAAAAVLGESIGARVETVDKVLDVIARHTHHPANPALDRELPPGLPQWVLDIDAETLVIVDEHVKLGNHKRLKLLQFLTARGATIRCIGDDHQLSSIEAGGAHADMADAAPEHALTLTHVVRFAASGEATASVGLRDGDPAALGWYLDHDRIHGGHAGAIHDDTYTAWAADRLAGRDAVMLAATHDTVTALNARARTDRLIHDGLEPGAEVPLADGLCASVGDTIRTRHNDPRLRFGDRDWVRNGYTWTVTAVHPDGSITASHRRSGGEHGASVWLPAVYVRAYVRLGYAATIDSAQGITADTCHVALTGFETRQQLYVAMTRGAHSNHAYLPTALDGSEASFWSEPAIFPRTAVEVLFRILDRDGAQKSAHTQLRDALDPFRRLGRAVDIYHDTLGLAAEHSLGADGLARLDIAANQIRPGLTDCPAYPVLRQHLAIIAMTGDDPITALREAADARELDTADDDAAVLDWRLDTSGSHSSGPGPLPWLPGTPPIPDDHPLAAHLHARHRIVTDLADQIRNQARSWTPATAPEWARPLIGVTDTDLVGELAVWRAGLHVAERDHRPTGPARFSNLERDHQHELDERIQRLLGDPNAAGNRWAPVAEQLEPRLTLDPFWPVMAEKLDLAHRAGLDITGLLTTAAAIRPLPDEMPAAALWARLELEPSALDAPNSTALHPEWLPDLHAVLGAELADRVIADPGWPRIVAVMDHASTGTWTPHDLLATAYELLLAAQPDDAPALRPDQLTAALAWRIDALTHHTPTPTEPEHHPEPNMPTNDEEHPPQTANPHPDNPPASDDLPEAIQSVAEIFRSGNVSAAVRAFRSVAAKASPEQRSVIVVVGQILYGRPWKVAKARLEWLANQNPQHTALIHACTPDTDPGVYQPDSTSPEREHQRTRRYRTGYQRRYRDTTQQTPTMSATDHAGLDLTDSYLDTNDGKPDTTDQPPQHGIWNPEPDNRTVPDQPLLGGLWNRDKQRDKPYRDRLDYDLAAVPDIRTLPCVSCGIERRRADATPLPPRRTDDGLCADCRDDHTGIPDHNQHPLEARCTYLANTHPPEATLALLRRDWRTLRNPAHRHIIETWIRDHPLTPADATVADHTTARRNDPLRLLTDDQLAERITNLELALTTPETEAAMYEPFGNTAAGPDSGTVAERHRAAQDAIRHAQQTADNLTAATHDLNTIRAELANARHQLTTTPRRQHTTLRNRIEELLTQQATTEHRHRQARNNHRTAHRHATQVAGPEPGWQELLASPPDHHTPNEAAHADSQNRAYHAQHAHLHGELTRHRAEQHRRQTLTPTQYADEEHTGTQQLRLTFDTELPGDPDVLDTDVHIHDVGL